MQSKLSKLLYAAPIIVATTVVNGLISFIMGWQVIEIYIARSDGPLVLTITDKCIVMFAAIGTYVYLELLPRIQQHIQRIQ